MQPATLVIARSFGSLSQPSSLREASARSNLSFREASARSPCHSEELRPRRATRNPPAAGGSVAPADAAGHACHCEKFGSLSQPSSLREASARSPCHSEELRPRRTTRNPPAAGPVGERWRMESAPALRLRIPRAPPRWSSTRNRPDSATTRPLPCPKRETLSGRDQEWPDGASRHYLDRRSSRRGRRLRLRGTRLRAPVPSDRIPAVVDLGQIGVVAFALE
jgi:hypothetical protein